MTKVIYQNLYDKLSQNICSEFSPAQARKRFLWCAESGLLKHAVPQDNGGYGDGFMELCKVYQQLGRTTLDTSLIISLHAHIWGSIFPILRFGSDEQKKMLPALMDGTIIAGHAITEPDAGSDVGAMKTTAISSDNGYILNGHKRYITNAAIADLILVYAVMDTRIAAFFVKKNDAGAEFINGHRVTPFGMSPIGEVILNNCAIPKNRILGSSDGEQSIGSMIIQYCLELERAFLFSGVLGVMQWQLDEVVKYAKRRIIHNEPLGSNQAVSHRIAEMKLRLDILNLLIYNCANLKDNRRRITLESSEVKLYASEVFLASSLDAVQIMGSKGIEVAEKMGTFVQDALAGRIFSGSSEIQKNIIAALLGVRKKHS